MLTPDLNYFRIKNRTEIQKIQNWYYMLYNTFSMGLIFLYLYHENEVPFYTGFSMQLFFAITLKYKSKSFIKL
ncbi:hypothetical protein DF185_21220 [Marinifilum breve]|uniref:Uncharacterized protein n=1 Tax=Marinifilum breve TaxID=2184082 RepID=A0A2V3ZSJ2_9BACT|nr:hypothetical protein DF185_21220 [Marinifilum breve]